MCPEEMVELSGLVELPMVELSGADCTCTFQKDIQFQNFNS